MSGLRYRFDRKRQEGILADVQDGEVYRAHFGKGSDHFLDNPYNISFAFNTDGVSPFKSSTFQLWPIFWQCLDLPPSLRYELRYTRLCGLWFGKYKPNLNLFFSPFQQDLQKFYGGGPSSFVAVDFALANPSLLFLFCRDWLQSFGE